MRIFLQFRYQACLMKILLKMQAAQGRSAKDAFA